MPSLHVVKNNHEQIGPMGQGYLVSGERAALRTWREQTGHKCESHFRDYETLGYLIEGRLQLKVEGESTTLEAGDSWLVSAGTEHSYEVMQDIVAVEATSPPARQSGDTG